MVETFMRTAFVSSESIIPIVDVFAKWYALKNLKLKYFVNINELNKIKRFPKHIYVSALKTGKIIGKILSVNVYFNYFYIFKNL